MIYVTGDIHADIDIGKLSTDRFPQQKSMSKNDHLIICGDFGLVWDDSRHEHYWRKWLMDKNFTTLWVDGNHENFELLGKFPLVDMFGGKVREICPSIYHLERGQIYSIEGKKFFTMGGASSHDKWCREEHISWWKEELPTTAEMNAAIDVLNANNWEVGYVLTHCAPESVQALLAPWYENDSLTAFLDRVQQDLQFRRWFFGHYHTDRELNEQFIALYNKIVPIE